MTIRHEFEPRTVDTFVVIDLDRTLLETSRLVEIVYRQLLGHKDLPDIDRGRVEQDIAFFEAGSGQSISLLDYLETQYGGPILNVLLNDVASLAASGDITRELLCHGAEVLLEQLETADIPYAILTYGERRNQEYKLDLLATLLHKNRRELHAIVTAHTNKADWIATTWESTDDGRLVVPEELYPVEAVHAKGVVIIDDKPTNLVSNDERIAGILVQNTKNRKGHILSTADVARLLSEGMSPQEIAASF